VSKRIWPCIRKPAAEVEAEFGLKPGVLTDKPQIGDIYYEVHEDANDNPVMRTVTVTEISPKGRVVWLSRDWLPNVKTWTYATELPASTPDEAVRRYQESLIQSVAGIQPIYWYEPDAGDVLNNILAAKQLLNYKRVVVSDKIAKELKAAIESAPDGGAIEIREEP